MDFKIDLPTEKSTSQNFDICIHVCILKRIKSYIKIIKQIVVKSSNKTLPGTINDIASGLCVFRRLCVAAV